MPSPLERNKTEIFEIPPGALLSIGEWFDPASVIVDGINFVTETTQDLGGEIIETGEEILLKLVEHANTIHSVANAAELVAEIISYLTSNNITLSSFISQLDKGARDVFQGFLEQ